MRTSEMSKDSSLAQLLTMEINIFIVELKLEIFFRSMFKKPSIRESALLRDYSVLVSQLLRFSQMEIF